MPIDFYCAKCGLLMRMGDEAAGREAKCPSCGAVTLVPGPLMQSNNPGQAPVNPVAGSGAGAPLAAGITPTIIDVGDVMGRAWEIYKHQMWKCILVLFVANIIGQLPSALVSVAEAVIEQNANQQDLAATQATLALLKLVFLPFSVWIGIGMALFMLKVARGQQAEFSDIFSGGPYLLSVFGAGFLFALMVGLGSVLCFVPGVFLALMFGEFYYLILDGRAGAIESLKLSKRITEGNKVSLLLIGLITLGLALAGVLACFVGIFFVFPYLVLLKAVAYLVMTGQPTGEKLIHAGQGPAM